MNQEIELYLEKYPDEIIVLFEKIRQIVLSTVSIMVEEKMWAKLPTYYINESFVRLIPFKDHINIEATAILNYKEELSNYKITPKGMLQIFINQDVPVVLLKKIFIDTLLNEN